MRRNKGQHIARLAWVERNGTIEVRHRCIQALEFHLRRAGEAQPISEQRIARAQPYGIADLLELSNGSELLTRIGVEELTTL